MGQVHIQAIGELFAVTHQVASGAKSALLECLVHLRDWLRLQSLIYFHHGTISYVTVECV